MPRAIRYPMSCNGKNKISFEIGLSALEQTVATINS